MRDTSIEVLEFSGILRRWRPSHLHQSSDGTELANTRHYFLQIRQALHHCHHPNDYIRPASGPVINGDTIDAEGRSRRVRILHRDLKPTMVRPHTLQTAVSLITILQIFRREQSGQTILTREFWSLESTRMSEFCEHLCWGT